MKKNTFVFTFVVLCTISYAQQATAALPESTPSESAVQSGQTFISPLSEWTLISPFGQRIGRHTNKNEHHNGIDMGAPRGTAVSAVLAGTVVRVGNSRVYGNFVIMKHEDGYQTLYAYLDKATVQESQQIAQGEQIGVVGKAMSTVPGEVGEQLHFTVYKDGKMVDPLTLIPGALPNIT